ncbi:MAG: DUF433 domain-containing protein [Fimbriimonadaceae bacterium]|nr:DUF433 domain-containing protein [Fimbriimonadaceae bacterium]
MVSDRHLVESNPEILGGTLVFAGTRVPVGVLYAYLERGKSLDEFLDCFPTVTREQAVELLKLAE